MSNTNLESAKKNHLKKRMEKESLESFNICKDFLSNTTYPEIQQEVFEKHFLNQFKTLLNEGRDPHLDEKEEKSISNMWVLAVGSVNTPATVVSGEGPNKQILGILPPLCAPMYLSSKDKKIDAEDKLKDALEFKNSNDTLGYMSKLEEGVKKITKNIKDNVIKMDAHKENWIKSITNIEEKIKENKKVNKTQDKEIKKSPQENTNVGTDFKW